MGVGLSILIFLKSLTLFITFISLKTLGYTLLSVPFLYASLISLLVSLASHPLINLPMLLGKKTDGSFPIWCLVMFSPYLYFVRVFSTLRRLKSKEDPFSEVVEGVYVGGWPNEVGKMPPGGVAVVDCTCELPRVSGGMGGYMCVPTWDTRACDPGEMERAVKWACRKKSQNVPVFVHCAYGHGRSVQVMCALLVSLGVVDNWKNAEKLIKEKRPYIRMNDLHRKALEEWSKDRLSSPKTGVNTRY
ncbi:dual specificity protein phosphatase domain-containing protein [Artemisia annua]|uniref:Dual specificity protein phosphatase domain-containing protein n=1 Tax=Artemisia annua TaxID=35608 RepID=A0A2U1KW29_ARTAN|nr:dual specificity protein phosphatase domain-containing protein [Artemisia annua]